MRRYGGFPKLGGYLFGGPHNKDYSILGAMLGSPYLWKLPYMLEAYWDDGKENGYNYCIFWLYRGLWKKQVETTIVYFGSIGDYGKRKWKLL